MTRTWISLLAVVLVLFSAAAAAAQAVTTGNITGRTVDETGLTLPGATVTITSPSMIGGGRTSATDDQGSYRFTLLVPGTYRVAFALDGFTTLNIDDVIIGAGNTMTINGQLKVGGVAEVVNVQSGAPTIDFEAATVSVNWNRDKLENLPFGKSLPALVNMIPGLSPTQFDVGGNTVGGTARRPARDVWPHRRRADQVRRRGVGSVLRRLQHLRQMQVPAAAKGAEAQSPGVTLQLRHQVRRQQVQRQVPVRGARQDDKFQGNNVTSETARRRASTPATTSSRATTTSGIDLGGPIIRDKLWFYGAYGYNYSGLLIPGFISIATASRSLSSTRASTTRPSKLTYQMHAQQQVRVHRAAEPQVAAVSQRQHVRAARSDAEPDCVDGDRPGDQVDAHHERAHDDSTDSFNRSGYWWPDYAWTDDVRRPMDLTTGTRAARSWTASRAGAVGMERHMVVVPHHRQA